MSNRKEPRLEIGEQQPTAKTASEAATKPEVAVKPSVIVNPEAPTSNASNAASIKSWLAIILAVLALGLLVWQFMQSKQQQDSMQALANRIQELEIRLHETGDDLSQAGNSFNEKLDVSMSEIDKLWKVAYRTNRPAIQALENTSKQLEQSLSKAEKQLAEALAASKLATTQGANLAKDLSKATGELNFHVKELGQRLTEISLSASTLDQRLRDQDTRTKVTALEKRVADLTSKVGQVLPDDMQAKLVEQDEILKSLEASRSQLVGRVTRLMEEVRELQQGR